MSREFCFERSDNATLGGSQPNGIVAVGIRELSVVVGRERARAVAAAFQDTAFDDDGPITRALAEASIRLVQPRPLEEPLCLVQAARQLRHAAQPLRTASGVVG